MIDERERYARAFQQFLMPEPAWDRLVARRDRKRRNQRIRATVLAIIVALVSFAAVIRTFGAVENRPADEPTPAPSPEGIFADVGGWIAYGNERIQEGPLGIWAVDPTRPNDTARIQLSGRPGTPLAWSSDGSKLLILRTQDRPGGTPGCPRCAGPSWVTLIALNADGTQTVLATNNPKVGGGPWLDRRRWIAGGSFSPDGSQVVFAASVERVNGIYTVDADGGAPRLVLAARPRTGVFNPAFSPDGTQIAYLELGLSFSLRVVNADGTGIRMLPDECGVYPSLGGPAWSPDGTHIAFNCNHAHMWVVGADGSGLARMPDGHNPYWSPDGSRLAFELRPVSGHGSGGRLAIANADGTHIQVFGHAAHVGPWNPLASAVLGDPNATATTGAVSPFVYATVALAVVGIFVLAWGARRRTTQRDSTQRP